MTATSTPPAQPAPDALPPDLEALTDLSLWERRLGAAAEWVQAHVLTLDFAIQAGVIAGALALGFALRGWFTELIRKAFDFPVIRRFQAGAVHFLGPVLGPALSWLLLSIALAMLPLTGVDAFWTRLAANLVGAWAVIRLLSAFIAEPFWARAAAATAWTIAALNILGWLVPIMDFMEALGFPFAGGRISALSVIRGVIVLIILYWLASKLTSLLNARINRLPALTSSARLLLAKTAQVALITVAGLLALSSLGVNIGALAIFGGAIGLGIGFGLQKIFSNLVSGVILLLDRSIKPGDVITVDDTYGRVNALGMRFASVVTRDGMEHLIPNEDLITNKVINWSFSDRAVRIKRPIGISYGSDVKLAQQLVVEAANTVPRVLKTPETRCLLRGFGDNSVDLEVRFWIGDPDQGVNNVASEVLMAIWDAFRENGVQFPFPQRDVHLIPEGVVDVRVTQGAQT
ncbi:MAG: mechanosensitive ion channel [Maricaulaceae bacterium]|nr:mechanosensitive ion channel [Maricaulaceae bacterium]